MTATLRSRSRPRPPVGQSASRLAAIRAIVALAEDDEDHDVAAGALLVLGASPQEIAAATSGKTG
jgi:hypothetical protein